MEEKQYVTSLVYAAKNGNDASFEELYNIYYQKIYALCLTTLKNSADAEDALQLTFINGWQNLGELKDNSSFNTWIQRIAVNQCYSILRKKKPDISVEEEEETVENIEAEDELSLPGVYAEREDLSERLKKVIDGLSEVQRQTILLYYYNGLTVQEIAEVMNCGENTVKSRLMLARRSVKTEIEEKERITGEKFFGVAGIPALPFAKMFTAQVSKTVIGKQAAATVFKGVLAAARPAATAVSAASAAAKAGVKAAANGAVKTGAKVTSTLITKIVAISAAAVIAVGGGTFGVAKLLDNTFSENSITDVNEKDLYDAELSSADEEEIVGFLETYCSFKEEYYNYDKAGSADAEDLYGIIGHVVSVDYSKYPVTLPKSLPEEETADFLQKNGYFAKEDGMWVVEYDKESVEWIVCNIFNMEKKTFEDMINKRIDESLKEQELGYGTIFKAKGGDNKDKYYFLAGGAGGPGNEVEITWARTDGRKYYIRFDEVFCGFYDMSYELLNINEFSGTWFDSKYAVMEKKNIDGKEYWTVYQIASDIPENIFALETPDAIADVSGTYFSDGHTEFIVNNDGTFTAEYSRTSYSDEPGVDMVLQYQKCSGKFKNITKIDKYSFKATISGISYKKGIDTTTYNREEGTKTVYTFVPGLDENQTVIFYLKGTHISKILAECSTGYYLDEDPDSSKAEHNYIHFKDKEELYISEN